jgi:hypothetical protein
LNLYFKMSGCTGNDDSRSPTRNWIELPSDDRGPLERQATRVQIPLSLLRWPTNFLCWLTTSSCCLTGRGKSNSSVLNFSFWSFQSCSKIGSPLVSNDFNPQEKASTTAEADTGKIILT